MTEEEWEFWHEPSGMTGIGNVSERKRRLFAVACCRRIPDIDADPAQRGSIEAVEQFAEGRLTREEAVEVLQSLNLTRWDDAAISESMRFEAADAGEFASYRIAEGL